MSGLGICSLLAGVLQLVVPSYALRLVRRFGAQQVGWFIVVAFASLALLHLVHPLKMPSLSAVGTRMDLVCAAASALLLIGMGHLDTLCSTRQRARREASKLQAQADLEARTRTNELAKLQEELMQEITRREQRERTLQETEAQYRVQLIGRLAGGVAHHFNNLLTVIDTQTSLLQLNKLDSRTAPEHLGQISAASARAATLTRQLLVAGAQYRMRPETLDLNGLLRQWLPGLRHLLGERIAFEEVLAPSLPPLQADPNLLEQIITQLFLNARDAMPGGGALTLSTELVRREPNQNRREPSGQRRDFIQLAVRDTGSGMTPAVQARLFEPFFTTHDVGQATGLGLASVYGAARQHAGWVECSTTLGRGTEFRVFLPCAAPA
jgi:signal transduction histidine kinase